MNYTFEDKCLTLALEGELNSYNADDVEKEIDAILEKNDASKKDMSFFDGLSDSWCDNKSPEEETASIRTARCQGKTRILEEF